MAMYKKIVLAQVVAIAVFCLLAVGVQSEPDIRTVHYACYGQLDPVSLNQDAVQAVRDDLVDNTVDRGFNFYNTDQFPRGAWCYGHAICRLRIPAEDCITSMIVAETVLLHACRFPGTADLALMDCRFGWQFNMFID